MTASFHGFPSEEAFLAHYGVPGMRWGRRKSEEIGPGRRAAAVQTPQRRLSANNQKAVTAAFAVGVVVVGAILLKRGNVNVADARSARIVVSGAKLSGRILSKTGKVFVKSGTTTAKVGAKVGVKAGATTGKLAGKGGLAAARASANAVTSNGKKLAEKVLKPAGRNSIKFGSHAMFKLTGKGTPIVKEQVKRGREFLNPIDLILANT